MFTKEPSIILQQNNSLEVSYLLIQLATSNNSLRCIIIVCVFIFSCCLWISGVMLTNITHETYSSLSIQHWYVFQTYSSLSSLGARIIGFSRTYNIFSFLRIILILKYQFKKFDLDNLLATNMLRRYVLLLILIYQLIHVKTTCISFMHIYLKLNLNKVFNQNLIFHYFLTN